MIEQISLAGAWGVRLDAEQAWRPITVPGCWEQLGGSKAEAGPVWYRRVLAPPASWAGRRLWLRFGAVSYHCAIVVDGQQLHEHTGCWDAFEVELTAVVAPGSEVELLVRVEKPAGLREGPGSAQLPGRFPLKETLSGFLPYVWGHMFGGIWQDVTLAATGAHVVRELSVRGSADGHVRVAGRLDAGNAGTSGPAPTSALALAIVGPEGSPLLVETEARPAPDGSFSVEVQIARPQPWSPWRPQLYELVLVLPEGDQCRRRFGLRTLSAEGERLLLNGQPCYPRMALSWGWYPEALHSNPGPARVREDFRRLRQLGYNGVKLCLWFPPQYYFDLADELGLLLWVELPMWLPRPSAFFLRQTPLEYERLVRQARQHPAVVLYSLGCELGGDIGADILGPLYELVRALAGDALVRDNSGSGEAYGGLLNEHAQYYDYHFYSEPHLLRQLVDYFTPRWRPRMPWVFGEFCDYDTLRDLPALAAPADAPSAPAFVPLPEPGVGGAATRASATILARYPGSPERVVSPAEGALLQPAGRPWWLSADPAANPQGARWQFDVVEHEARLRAAGLWERSDELRRLSHEQGLLHRKLTLELVRTYGEISGYVVSGEADTPITTAGMWDDLGRLKFDPLHFRTFNDDLVLLVGWGRRRAWVAGGDRAASWDTRCYHPGALVRPHLLASCFGPHGGEALLEWDATLDGDPPLASGKERVQLAPGRVAELAVAELRAPVVEAPRPLRLRALLSYEGGMAYNDWTLWVLPRPDWALLAGVALLDPAGRLGGLRALAGGLRHELPHVDASPPLSEAPPIPAGQDDAGRGTGAPAGLATRARQVAIATAWSAELAAFIQAGGRALLLQGHGATGPLPAVELPFWREAIKFAEPHPAWGDFPHAGPGLPGVELFGCATDLALDCSHPPGPLSPLLRRLDARTLRLHDYAVELQLGHGRMIVTTLRLEGGLGEQPDGIERNTAAAYLLWCWTRYLVGLRSEE